MDILGSNLDLKTGSPVCGIPHYLHRNAHIVPQNRLNPVLRPFQFIVPKHPIA
jgi:hypothetical protein